MEFLSPEDEEMMNELKQISEYNFEVTENERMYMDLMD